MGIDLYPSVKLDINLLLNKYFTRKYSCKKERVSNTKTFGHPLGDSSLLSPKFGKV